MTGPMPLSTVVSSSQNYYRITPTRFNTGLRADHLRVVNGEGAVYSLEGHRYNYPGALTVYLTQDMETCFAERMFYLHRDIVRGLDVSHIIKTRPHFYHHFTLWEILFAKSMNNLFDLKKNSSLFSIFPSMMTNPSQDYEHLKNKRAEIQNARYDGLVAPSSRSTKQGNIIVLFHDQSGNVKTIERFNVQFRLINEKGDPFANHVTELLDFGAGEVQVTGHPSGAYANWTKIQFNR